MHSTEFVKQLIGTISILIPLYEILSPIAKFIEPFIFFDSLTAFFFTHPGKFRQLKLTKRSDHASASCFFPPIGKYLYSLIILSSCDPVDLHCCMKGVIRAVPILQRSNAY